MRRELSDKYIAEAKLPYNRLFSKRINLQIVRLAGSFF